MGTGAEVDVPSEDRRPAPCLAPRRLGSGMTNKAWAFRKRAALDPSQDFAQGQLFVYSSSFPSHFLFFHLLPFSGCLLHPAGGDGARRSRGWGGSGGDGSCQTDPLPNRGYSGGYSLPGRLSHTHQRQRGWGGVGGRTAEPTSSSPGGVLGSSPACGRRCPGSQQAGLCLPRRPAAADLIRAPIMEARAVKGP